MNETLVRDLRALSLVYVILLDDSDRFMIITDFCLPPG